MAMAMPVLPDDDSMIVQPGVTTPSFSASSIMVLAARSFTEPPGFWPSSLARMRTFGLGLSSLTSRSGVLPIRSRTLAKEATCGRLPSRLDGAAGHGRQDGDLVVVADLGVQALQVAHVVVADVDVDELV